MMSKIYQFKNGVTPNPGLGRLTLMLLLVLISVLGSTNLYAQDPPQYGTPFAGVPNRMDANIYQLNFREYTPQRTIVAAKNNMQRLKDLGINVIYLMPFTSVTTDPVKGIDRSPYSIKDLKAVDPELGTLQDIRDYVAQAHTLGMAVIFDFVPNQTAWDHPWITQHNDWYAKNPDGTIRSPDAGAPGSPFLFTDVAELNLNNTTVVNAIIDAARYWIFAANFDGIRLDWADKAGQAFNNTFVTNMRGITSHNLLLLAEGSNEGSTSGCNTCGDNQPGAHWAQGFDYIYGTNFYWNVMKKVWKSGEPAKNLNDITNVSVNGVSLGEYGSGTFTGFPTSSQLVARFLSSHDNYNEDGSPFIGNGNAALGGRNAVMSAFVVIAYHRGVPFIYNGLDVGNTNPLPYPWRTGTINWTQDLTVYTEMQKILSVRNASVALRRGQPTSYIDPANTNPDVMAFTKTSGSEKVAVMVNVRNSNRTFTIPAGMAGTYYNAFVAGGSAVTLTTGSVVTLTPYQYLVYTNANVPVVPVTGVTVSPTSASVKVGLTQQVTASVAPSNATNQNVTWSSSNNAIATVSATGLVTAVATGTATITVTTQDGNRTATCAVTVTPATTFTVYFYKPAAWGTDMRIHYWDAQPTGVLASTTWPGVAMTLGADGWYSHTFSNVTTTNLIFNANSDVNKTVDLTRGSTGWYLGTTWYTSKPAIPNSLTVSPSSLSVGSGSGSSAIAVTSNVSWTVSDDQSWITTSATSGSNNGSFNVTVTANTGAARSGTVTVTGGSITQTISVAQAAAPGAVALPGTIQAESWTNMSGVQTETTTDTGGGLNVGWIDAGDWMDYSVNVASAGTYTVSFRMASGGTGGTLQLRNSGGTTLSSATVGGTGGWQTWTTVTATATLVAGTQTLRLHASTGGYNVNWVQFVSVANNLTVSPTSLSVGSAAGNSTITVTSNVSWTITDNQTWITTSATSGSNNGTFTVGVTANTGAARSGTVTVTGGGFTRTISVAQSAAGNSLTVSPTSLSVGSAAGNSTITVTSNVNWTISDNQTWITTSATSGSNNGTFTVSVTANTGAARSGTVTVTGGSITQTISVSQGASGATYYAFQNRWTGAYLYDAGASVGYGATVANNNYKWEKVTIDATFFWVRNLGTGEYMHIENQTGAVQCTGVTLDWWSAQWSQETAEGSWVRVRNRWQTGSMIHVENQNGSAQYAGAQNGWHSAQWQLVPVSGSRFGSGASELLDDDKVSIYPNPFKSSLTLDLPEFEQSEVSLNIFDTSGRLVLARKLEMAGNSSVELNLDELHSGVYFLKAQTPAGIRSFKVIKE